MSFSFVLLQKKNEYILPFYHEYIMCSHYELITTLIYHLLDLYTA